jgi:hypoxanthine phosphoribosyltransferase
VRALAARLRDDYRGRDLVVAGVLKGAFVFLADLVRELRLPVQVDFVGVSSYGSGSVSSGTPRITTPLRLPVAGRDVLVVEDILDTGRTLRTLLAYLGAQRPRSVRVCALLDKRARRAEAVPADYVGFDLPDGFVVGYGIDYAERYRELPGLYRLAHGPRGPGMEPASQEVRACP